MTRCNWCLGHDIYEAYHDEEWGVPVFDDQKLFEILILEGAQAGLNWLTVLKKREGYRKAFDNFDINKVSRYSDKKKERLKNDPGIIRNRLKIESAVKNAKGVLVIQKEFGSFSDYLWHFTDGKVVQNKWKNMKQVPVTSPLSDQISKDLKKRGFSFVGSTIIYAYLQATGVVNDHITSCFRHKQLR